jgi:hypothetical protein
MELVSIDQLRLHCKADGDDDDLLTVYGNGAEAACARLANRNLYPDAETLAAAKTAAAASQSAAWATYDAAVTLASANADTRVKETLIENARWELNTSLRAAEGVMNGLVVNDETNSDVISAILLVVGNWYENRSEVVTGQGAAAVNLPMAAHHIMAQYHYVGPLIA